MPGAGSYDTSSHWSAANDSMAHACQTCRRSSFGCMRFDQGCSHSPRSGRSSIYSGLVAVLPDGSKSDKYGSIRQLTLSSWHFGSKQWPQPLRSRFSGELCWEAFMEVIAGQGTRLFGKRDVSTRSETTHGMWRRGNLRNNRTISFDQTFMPWAGLAVSKGPLLPRRI